MNERKIGIDIIKTLASFLVVLLHTQVNYFDSGAFIPNYSVRSLIFYAVRYVSLSCVPLLLLSTGYLQPTAEISKSFFLKIKKCACALFFNNRRR